ncbi:hypothetical protein [Chroococcidiopsis cubana]|nr:hypothetical protein [Chroococcidiopsis cubana]
MKKVSCQWKVSSELLVAGGWWLDASDLRMRERASLINYLLYVI